MVWVTKMALCAGENSLPHLHKFMHAHVCDCVYTVVKDKASFVIIICNWITLLQT